MVNGELEIRYRKGYREFYDNGLGSWVAVHRRAWEKGFGRIPVGYHIHHIDEDKENNRIANLTLVHPKVHARIHGGYDDVCFCCGRESHHVVDCYATTFWDGEPLPTVLIARQRARR